MNNPVTLLLVVSVFHLNACATDMPLVSNAGNIIDTSTSRVHSMKELREKYIEMQREDYSCGAASLATLMRHYFNEDINETKVLNTVKEIFTSAEYEVIADMGLSFRELGLVSEALGFQSAAVRLTTEALHKLQGPVLIYVETAEYKHFAVFRGISDGYAYLADPSRGNIRLTMQSFLDEWKGQALVLGKPGFGVPEDHNLAILDQSPYNDAVIFRQLENRLAPTQQELLGDTNVL